MPKKLQNIAILSLFWSFFFAVQAQNIDSTATPAQEIRYDDSARNRPEIDKNALNQYKNEDAFDYKEIVPPDNWWTRFNNWLSETWSAFINWILNGSEAQGFLKFFLRALPYIIIISVLIFLVWLFIKADMAGSPLLGGTPNKMVPGNEEQIIKNQDIQALIDSAVKEKNYRLAVRYYYLLVLQQLSKNEIIDWQSQKTNHDYVYEIKDEILRGQFSKVTRIYDFIWYGSFEVNAAAFAKAQHEFLKVANRS